jgi:hypothetical protein
MQNRKEETKENQRMPETIKAERSRKINENMSKGCPYEG